MKVLVGCEHSGRVRDAFIRRGHDAVSCDLLPTTIPGPHLQCDVLTVLDQGWDLAVFHPDCTYLCSSGLHWNSRVGEFGEFTEASFARRRKTEAALDFVRKLMAAPIEKIAIENPRGRIGTAIRPAEQTIQPYEFGEDASKATCFWLKGLTPIPIDPSKRFPGRWVVNKKGKLVERWSNQTDAGQNNLGPSESRWADRSLTYLKVADAMADHWGGRTLPAWSDAAREIEEMLG